jgi:uncharacterized membrane protein
MSLNSPLGFTLCVFIFSLYLYFRMKTKRVALSQFALVLAVFSGLTLVVLGFLSFVGSQIGFLPSR